MVRKVCSLKLDRKTIVDIVASGPNEGLQAAEITTKLGLQRDQRARVRKFLKQLALQDVLIKEGRFFRLGHLAHSQLPTQNGRLKVRATGRGAVTTEQYPLGGFHCGFRSRACNRW